MPFAYGSDDETINANIMRNTEEAIAQSSPSIRKSALPLADIRRRLGQVGLLDLLVFGLAAETFPDLRRRSDGSRRGLWRRFLFLLRRRRLLHPLLLARRGAALCLPGFLGHVQPPDRVNQNYAIC